MKNMKSSAALILMAGAGVAISVIGKSAGYSGDITSEIILMVCAAHICRVLEDKL